MQKSGIIVFVLLLVLIVLPASASTGITPAGEVSNLSVVNYNTGLEKQSWFNVGSLSFNSATGEKLITRFTAFYGPGDSASYVIHLNNGETITARVESRMSYYGFYEEFYMELGSASHTISGFIDPFFNHNVDLDYWVSDQYMGSGDNTYYIGFYRMGLLGLFPDEPILLYELEGRPSENPIIQVDLVSGGGTIGEVWVQYQSTREAQEAETFTEKGYTDWIARLKNFFSTAWTAIMTIWGVFSFVFIEHLLLTILLVEGAVLAYHLNNSGNIFIAFSRVGQTNVFIARFIFEAINYVIGYLHQVIDSFKPI